MSAKAETFRTLKLGGAWGILSGQLVQATVARPRLWVLIRLPLTLLAPGPLSWKCQWRQSYAEAPGAQSKIQILDVSYTGIQKHMKIP